MIVVKNIDKLTSIVATLNDSNLEYKVFGEYEETFRGLHAGAGRPDNNYLVIKLLLASTIGTFVCVEKIRLSDPDLVETASAKFQALNAIECKLSYNRQTGTVEMS
jgi:hypothetical protein